MCFSSIVIISYFKNLQVMSTGHFMSPATSRFRSRQRGVTLNWAESQGSVVLPGGSLMTGAGDNLVKFGHSFFQPLNS